MRKTIGAAAAALTLALAAPAGAHVTVQPEEATTASFARFVVRVPNEADDGAATTKVEVRFPPTLVGVRFQPKEGWTRTVQRRPLDEPVEVFGEQVTDYVASVTWEGGRIGAGEFDEFGFTARTPEDPTTLEFPAVQTYDSGQVVRWIGPEDADEPAARVSVGAAEPAEPDEPAADDEDEDDDEDDGLAVALGGAAFGLSLLALGVAVARRRR